MPEQPTNNATKNCQKGWYLWGRVNSVGDPYFGQIRIPSIDLGQPGTYEMTYHLVMFCDGTACSNADDSITVIINEQAENVVNRVDYTNIGNLRRWEKKSFRFTVSQSEIEVTIYLFFFSFILPPIT